MPGISLLVCHLPEIHIDFVKRKGLTPVQIESWKKTFLNKVPLKELLLCHESIQSKHSRVKNIYVSKYLAIPTDEQNALYQYFVNYFEWIFGYIKKKKKENDSFFNKEYRIVINLFPFTFCSSVADKIIRGLRLVVEKNSELLSSKHHIQILTRNSNSFKSSHFYKDTIENEKYSISFSLVDYKGFRTENLSNTNKLISRDYFYKTIKIDDQSFYNKLIYETNSYIGHFVLEDSHIRTHYDLKDFIRKDVVFERLYDSISNLLINYSNILILHTGIEDVALQNLCTQLSRYNESISMYLNAHNNSSETYLSEYLAGIDCILILTDIVNSGTTIEKTHSSLINLIEDKIPIIFFSVITMANSSSKFEIHESVKIKRDYYKPNPLECDLCKLGQPPIKINIVDDFKQIPNQQLTPFDFWEIVNDSKAFKEKETDNQGRLFAFRIDTFEVIKRYRCWLSNVIKSKYKKELSNRKPTAILTVDEKGGRAFAELVCDSLDLDKDIIIAIKREQLRKEIISSSIDSNSTIFSGKRVLLVDDGINDGGTIKMLSDYCIKNSTDPIAIFVLDSRLTAEQYHKLRNSIGRIPIISLYRWAGKVIRYSSSVG